MAQMEYVNQLQNCLNSSKRRRRENAIGGQTGLILGRKLMVLVFELPVVPEI